MKTSTVAAVVAGISSLLYAEQNTNEVATLPPVTVYASRTGSTKDEMPASVQLFTAADIESSGAKDLAELLKKKAGVDIHAMNGNPILTSIAMRGFGDNAFGRTKIILDGEELNNVDMSNPNLSRVPVGSVERVEIIRGPSPVLYGDGAVAGVVNVITDAQDYGRKTKFTGKAGSQNTFGGNVQTKGGFEEDGVLYNASYDFLQSDGYRKNSAYDMHTANAGIRKNFDNGSSIGLKAGYQNAFYELPGRLTYSQWKNSRRSSNDRDNWCRIWSYGISLDSRFMLDEDQWLLVDSGFSRQYRNANWGQWGYANEYSLYGFHLAPRYVNEMDVFGFGNKFTAGFEYRHDYDGVTDRSNPPKSRFNRDRSAGFIHDEFHIWDGLSLIAGTRLEFIDNRWTGMGPWTGWSGMRKPKTSKWMSDYELGLVYRPVDDFKTFLKGTRFHRSAFCDEMNYSVDGQPLDPETGASLDVGVEFSFLDEFRFDVNGYAMVMEDEIFLSPNPLANRNCNSPAKTRRIGMDSGLSWRRDKFAEASVRYGLVRSDFAGGEYHGCDIPYVPNHRIRAEAGYWIFDDLEIKVGYSYTSSQYLSGDYLNESDKLPAYSLFDITICYEPSCSWAKGWRAAFTIDNLFDRNYCDYALYSAWGNSYYPACGRSFMFTLSYEF